jgi:hypothetical protein
MEQKKICPLKKPLRMTDMFSQLKNKNLFPETAIFQELKYIYIINMHVCNTTNRFKYKKRRIRTDKKRRIRRYE